MRWVVLLALMTLSGFCGLGYQIVWTQQGALYLGHESAAVLAVVTAFFAGLAVGASVFAKRIGASTVPLRWYAGCELLIGAWGLLMIWLLAPYSAVMLRFIGADAAPLRQWSIAFGGVFLLLLPATAAMGATLPAMQRVAAQLQSAGRSVAPLYAFNTLGAMLGVLAIAFGIAPALGLIRTAAVCIGGNFLCAAAALALANSMGAVSAKSCSTPRVGGSARLLWILGATGFLGIGYEVLVVRVLSQVTEDTVYTFALLLAVYLGGTALGAAAYDRWRRRSIANADPTDSLLSLLSLACLVGIAALYCADRVKVLALAQWAPTLTTALGVEALLALCAFGLPTVAMGALFSHLSSRAVESGMSLGGALSANTLGAAAAPVAFGVLAIPLWGPKTAVLLVAIGYLLLTHRESWLRAVTAIPASIAAAAFWLLPQLAFVDVPDGGRVVSYKDGIMASVSVVEDAGGVGRLRIDNRQQEGSSATRRVDSRQALLPILLHPAPRHALFLGLGTGVTAASATADPQLQVDAVELLPEVIAASGYFLRGMQNEAGPIRVRLVAADARRYVRGSEHHYDVIVADNYHPARSGSGSLYTVEHFQAIKERLETQGVFVQWLPLHQLDLSTLRSIVQSYLRVFPGAAALLASNSLETPVIGLVSRADGGRWDVAATQVRMAGAVRQPAAGAGIEDEFALLGSFVADAPALRRLAGNAPENTDDFPIVTYRAPRITYAADSAPRDRLIELLHTLSIDPGMILTDGNPSLARRLTSYWAARNQFIEAGRDVRPTADVSAMLAQVRVPLLHVLQLSADFRPAYDPLVMIARALADVDPAGARELLSSLVQIAPSRTEAAEELQLLQTAR